MVIGVVRAELHMPGNRSLKDKRQIVKSVIAQAQNRFRIGVAEVERQDEWQRGVLGFVCVSADTAHAQSVVSSIVRYMEDLQVDAHLIDVETEIVQAL